MALMFPRLARNFAKNGYYPTDEASLERTLSALAPSDGPMCICDPCAGEGVAIAEAAHALGPELTSAYAVEFDQERATHARLLVDHCIHGDLMDTMISRQAFGLLWLNPPYGDLARDTSGNLGYEGKGRARLEKLFYQRTLPLLQYGGILVFILPSYVLDKEMVGWLTRHFADLSVFQAVDKQFKQVVVFGRRVRQRDQAGDDVKASRARLLQIGLGEQEADELPPEWTLLPYVVPTAPAEPEHFYRISMEPEQFADEVRRLKGLWPAFETHLGATQQTLRAPARALSQWHLALALAAGAISGVVQSPTGRTLAVKGDTFKQKSSAVEYRERDDGSLAETRILTDKFVPVIRAWDLTLSSSTLGQVLTIHRPRRRPAACSSTPARSIPMLSIFQGRKPQVPPLFALGTLKLSEKVHWLASKSLIDPLPYVQRHVRGDWGEASEAECQMNDVALEQGAPMTSRFKITPRLFLLVITSDDQCTTVVQLPEEKS